MVSFGYSKEVWKNFRGTKSEVGRAREQSSESSFVKKVDTCTRELREVVCEKGRYVYERALRASLVRKLERGVQESSERSLVRKLDTCTKEA